MAKAISDPHVLVPSPSIIFFAVHVDDIISAASLPEENPKEDDRGRGQPAAGQPGFHLSDSQSILPLLAARGDHYIIFSLSGLRLRKTELAPDPSAFCIRRWDTIASPK
jgi:hypothetical protein